MTDTRYAFQKGQRTLFERLFEPPAVGKMSPVAKVVAYGMLAFWSAFVMFPLYWVLITAFKNGQLVNEGPYYIPFVDFQPTLQGWRDQLNALRL
jgi:multiple sugar transport system permease protein